MGNLDKADGVGPREKMKRGREKRTSELPALFRMLAPLPNWALRALLPTRAQDAMGLKSTKENLVRHGRKKDRERSWKKMMQALWRMLVALMPYMVPVVAYVAWGDGVGFAPYLADHLALALFPLLPIVAAAIYVARNRARTHPPQQKGKPRRDPKPPWPPVRQHTKDIADIIANLDHPPLRIGYLALLWGGAFVAGSLYPFGVSDFGQITEEATTSAALGAITGGSAAFVAARLRTAFVNRQREDEIEEAYYIGVHTLGFNPKPPAKNATAAQMREATPWLAIRVKKWWALYEIDTAFVSAPQKLDVNKIELWDDFADNLNAKMPRPEEWRIRRDPHGKGATIGPANYPVSILWDGQYDPDPLTFWIGANLETGEDEYLTFSDVSPHMGLSGGTSSGKTSLAEVIAAQVLIKPMPWDNNQCGRVVIVDPKGPFARRWLGRPGVVAINGQEDAAEPDDEGNPITGPVVMAAGMEWIEEEHQRRANVLGRYEDAATWMDLPNSVKRDEKLFPIFVLLDEYIDHLDIEKSDEERVVRENAARVTTTRLASWHARKYRNVGMHTILIAQEVKMTGPTGIGSVLLRQLAVRAVTGQMDPSQLQTMFGDTPVPAIPSTKTVFDEETGLPKQKTIPGRARIMNAGGQPVRKIQVPWFGGDTNSETLQKWLPRGPKPPNGDFSLPPGKPRKPSDFDEEGNLIDLGADTADAATPAVDAVDGEAQFEQDGPEPTDADIFLGKSEDSPAEDVDGSDDMPWGDDGEAPPEEELPANPIFPGAQPEDYDSPEAFQDDDPHSIVPDEDALPDVDDEPVEPPCCSQEGCSNDIKQDCAKCGEPYCKSHLDRVASERATDLFCPSCRAEHPLVQAGIEGVYAVMEKETRPMRGFRATYDTLDEGAVLAVITIPTGQKLVEVRGTPGEAPSSRSRSDQRSGEEDVIEHIQDALAGYRSGERDE